MFCFIFDCRTWIAIETIMPNNVKSLNGTIMNQISADSSNAHSQRKAAATKMMMRIGSLAMVSVNIANGGPNARNAHPKNSGSVILCPFMSGTGMEVLLGVCFTLFLHQQRWVTERRNNFKLKQSQLARGAKHSVQMVNSNHFFRQTL